MVSSASTKYPFFVSTNGNKVLFEVFLFFQNLTNLFIIEWLFPSKITLEPNSTFHDFAGAYAGQFIA